MSRLGHRCLFANTTVAHTPRLVECRLLLVESKLAVIHSVGNSSAIRPCTALRCVLRQPIFHSVRRTAYKPKIGCVPASDFSSKCYILSPCAKMRSITVGNILTYRFLKEPGLSKPDNSYKDASFRSFIYMRSRPKTSVCNLQAKYVYLAITCSTGTVIGSQKSQ